MHQQKEEFFVGVDVGTGSVRAALVSRDGVVHQVASKSTKTWNPAPGFYEQSSDDIWSSCCAVIKDVIKDKLPDQIKGIGFDATCSLVVLDAAGQPVTVSQSGIPERNVILWMDHRAEVEAQTINQLKHPVLDYVGGKISLEMETPKLMWLKKNLRKECWDKAEHFFDLPDFLTWKATNVNSRSLCSLVCKWTYQVDSKGKGHWSEDYFNQIGLSDLKEDNWKKIGTKLISWDSGSEVKMPGSPVGEGVSASAALETGLKMGTAVGTSLIDAHAGTLSLLGCSAPNVDTQFSERLGLICGTSSCHMAVAKQPLFVPGVWGPYFSAVVPGYWLSEGGQSVTGRLLDFIVDSHPASAKIKAGLEEKDHIHIHLNNILQDLASKTADGSVSRLTQNIHVLPDFHGNRSPLADSTMRGMISGLSLNSDEQHLAVIYLATVQALAYGTKHVAEALCVEGHKLKVAALCGGLSHNQLFVQTLADVLGLPLLRPVETESMLVGAAILGACAAASFNSVTEAICSMGGQASVIQPSPSDASFHMKKYGVFVKMIEDHKIYQKLMQN